MESCKTGNWQAMESALQFSQGKGAAWCAKNVPLLDVMSIPSKNVIASPVIFAGRGTSPRSLGNLPRNESFTQCRESNFSRYWGIVNWGTARCAPCMIYIVKKQRKGMRQIVCP